MTSVNRVSPSQNLLVLRHLEQGLSLSPLDALNAFVANSHNK